MDIRRKFVMWLIMVPAMLSAFGFNEHKVIAGIAWMELTPEARSAVVDLLKVSGDTSMVGIAIWADEIKSQEKYRYASTYHYINIPADGVEYSQERDCPDRTCITEVLPQYINTLQDLSASDSLRNEALKFIIHFVGDIHQPMHCGLPEDRGGNEVKLYYRGEKTNLHGLWDYGINNARIKDFGKYTVKRHVAGSRMDLDDILSVTDPVEWTNESYTIARKVAYTVENGDKVSRRYARRAGKAIDKRITVAGYRLAFLLNSIFIK